mmetsp:Transcript_3545/g.7659  ORF Transcript_3545/g.7659 Transcript_3545/m.7659 type:complete len:222 (+) Transcript_3545:1715-2380(+)
MESCCACDRSCAFSATTASSCSLSCRVCSKAWSSVFCPRCLSSSAMASCSVSSAMCCCIMTRSSAAERAPSATARSTSPGVADITSPVSGMNCGKCLPRTLSPTSDPTRSPLSLIPVSPRYTKLSYTSAAALCSCNAVRAATRRCAVAVVAGELRAASRRISSATRRQAAARSGRPMVMLVSPTAVAMHAANNAAWWSCTLAVGVVCVHTRATCLRSVTLS